MKNSIFHCGKYPHLGLTITPFNYRDDKGNKVKAQHIHFGTDPILGAGILRTSDEAIANYVRESEYFKSGKIMDVSDAKPIPVPKLNEKVQTGVHNTSDVRKPNGEPKDESRPVTAAKVPGRGKK